MYSTDSAHLKKKWDALKTKYTRRRQGARYKDWPLYEKFDELFGKFIQQQKWYYLHPHLLKYSLIILSLF